MNWAGTGWSYHPVQDAAGAVWIQLGIGVWLLASARGRGSRAAGLAGAGWGLVVWVFGEAFGGVFSPGGSLLTGTPGAALLYTAGGLLVALPARFWATRALGRWWLRLVGLGLVAGAVLQAWPGRGYWQGTLGGQPGSLTDMVRSMATTPQPGFLARLVAGFGDLVAAHGFAVNLLAVVLLAAGGAALLSGRRSVLRPAVLTLTAFFLVTWVLVQDFGFFGGLGTDPNSMIPMIVLLTGAFATVATGPAVAAVTVAVEQPADAGPSGGGGPSVRARRRPARRLRLALGTASASVVVALWAGAVMLLGAEPMAVAEVQRTADPILATALNGQPTVVDRPSVPFDLTDQNGRQVSLASLRGKVVLLTFLDPVCVSDCPLVAQQFRAADQLLGSQGPQRGPRRDRGQPGLPVAGLHQGVRSAGVADPAAELALPDRLATAAHHRLARVLRDRGAERAGRDGPAPGRRLRHRRERRGAAGAEPRSGPGHGQLAVVVRGRARAGS